MIPSVECMLFSPSKGDRIKKYVPDTLPSSGDCEETLHFPGKKKTRDQLTGQGLYGIRSGYRSRQRKAN